MFELATKGMTPRQAREWWKANPESYGGKSGRNDLGPPINIPKGKIKLHKPRKDKTEWEEECEDSWYKTGSITLGIAIKCVSEYSVVREHYAEESHFERCRRYRTSEGGI